MSRTDVHAPYWTWATWYEPSHHLWCPFRQNRTWATPLKNRVCNLPERPVRHAGVRTRIYAGLCTWEPVRPTWRECRWLNTAPVPRWYVDHMWTNAERVRQRDGLREMAKRYNATGELDDGDFPNWQHRHGATWYWD